jgi:nuclear GTP-binding protein
VAPIPGETKIWQYITLMKRIYLIDCPGVVPPSNTDTPQDILLRGVVRVENVENPEQYIPAVLSKTKPQHIERTYQLKGYKDHIEFLELLARKGGRLLHGGEPDVDGVAKMVLNDFLRGKIPWFTPPPILEGAEEKGIEGREGRLGEMGRKRKRDDESTADTSVADLTSTNQDDVDDDDDEFEGFNSDGGVDLDDVVADVDEAFGLDSEDEDSEVGSDDDEDEEVDGVAEEQLQDELEDDVDLSREDERKPPKKKRQKT